MNKELIQHLTESIEHYDRMIEWVKTQPENGRSSIEDMLYDIKEQWSCFYCSLCKNYFDHVCICLKCILYQKGYYCNKDNSIWKRMHFSITWKDWLIYANQMRKILIDIRKEVRDETN